MSTPPGGRSGGGTPGSSGEKPQPPAPKKKPPRKAKLRRGSRLSRLRAWRPPRPRLRKPGRPSLKRPSRPTLRRPSIKLPRSKRADDLWFRLVTRIRATGYWLREKGKVAWRALIRAGRAIGLWWEGLSHLWKIRIGAVAGVLVLYLIVKFISLPGVPCEVSAAKECAPSNDTIAYVPQDALLYAHMTVNSSSHQWELAGDLRDELPSFGALLKGSVSSFGSPAPRPLDLSTEILPWAKDDIAVVMTPLPKRPPAGAFIVGVDDAKKADQFIASIVPAGKPKVAKVGSTTVNVYAGGFATARDGDEQLFGGVDAVRTSLAARSGKVPRLEGTDQSEPLDALPDVRLAEVYLSSRGIKTFIAGRGGRSTQLDTFVDYGASKGMAASATAEDDGLELNLMSDLDPKLEQRSPTVFADLPRFTPGLADEAGPRALGYVGVGELGPALNRALATAGKAGQGLAGSLRQLAQSLEKQAGVDPLRDLLPALGGQAALVAEPTDAAPYASLIVDGVDEERASTALERLQQPLLRSLSGNQPVAPSFQTEEVDGVKVFSVEISPTVGLSYAIFDGKLVISTQPAGIAQVRSSASSLAGSGAYQAARDALPDQVSALVFLDLNEVFGLAQRLGLAENALYASLSQDIARIRSLGLAVSGSDEELRSELFLAIQH